jgi:pyruvate formate lyase activating enzyme
VESSAFAAFGVIDPMLPYLDQFLLDVKHLDSAKHEAYTGTPNQLILENAKKIAKGSACLIVRTPVIPGFNDTVEEIRDIAVFAQSLGSVREIHLIAYHRLGQGKYEALGRPYLMDDAPPPTDERMALLKEAVLSATRLYCQIGG